MRLQIIVEGSFTVNHLAEFEAETIQQAARNQARWCEEDEISPLELLAVCDELSVRVEGIED